MSYGVRSTTALGEKKKRKEKKKISTYDILDNSKRRRTQVLMISFTIVVELARGRIWKFSWNEKRISKNSICIKKLHINFSLSFLLKFFHVCIFLFTIFYIIIFKNIIIKFLNSLVIYIEKHLFNNLVILGSTSNFFNI